MIYRLFNNNKPIVQIILPLLGVLLWMPSIYNNKGVQFIQTYGLFEFLDKVPIMTGQFISIVIIISTAIILSYTINKSELFSKNQYLPALLYIMIVSSDNDFHVLNPIIVGNLMLSLAVLALFNVYRQVPCKNLIFKSSCLVLLATIFYFPFIVFFLLPWLVLSIIRPFEPKEWLMPIVGLAVIVFYLILIHTISPSFFDFKFSFKEMQGNRIELSLMLKLIYGLLIIGCFSSLLILLKLNAKSTNRFRKLSLILLAVFLLFIALAIYSNYYLNLTSLVLLAGIPISLLLPLTLVHSKKKWLSELFLSAVFILILFDLYFI